MCRTETGTELSEADVLILQTVQDTALWKAKLHEKVREWMSVQTVGRHVDQLHADDLLETRILNAPESRRDLLIGYTTTEEGDEALRRLRWCRTCCCVVDPDVHRSVIVPFTQRRTHPTPEDVP